MGEYDRLRDFINQRAQREGHRSNLRERRPTEEPDVPAVRKGSVIRRPGSGRRKKQERTEE